MKAHSVTLREVAQSVGYSINTVSRALRDKNDIAPETREYIRQEAARLGYVNNSQASSLRLGYTNTIAVILGDISNPHFAILTKEIGERADRLGYSTVLLNSGENEQKEFNAIQTALSKNVDGMIICPAQKSSANIRLLKKTGMPFVLIGRHFDREDTDFVICNDELGGYQATKHLIEHGHRNILMLNGPEYISSAKERLAGYRRALEEYSIPYRTELVRKTDIKCGRTQAVLSEIAEEGTEYSAIFAFSDLIAWEAWTYCVKNGRRVPEDCSIIGFDYIGSRLTLPFGLSSVSSHKYKMSVAAVELLAERIKDPDAAKYRHVIIDTVLAPGDTVADVR